MHSCINFQGKQVIVEKEIPKLAKRKFKENMASGSRSFKRYRPFAGSIPRYISGMVFPWRDNMLLLIDRLPQHWHLFSPSHIILTSSQPVLSFIRNACTMDNYLSWENPRFIVLMSVTWRGTVQRYISGMVLPWHVNVLPHKDHLPQHWHRTTQSHYTDSGPTNRSAGHQPHIILIIIIIIIIIITTTFICAYLINT